MKYEIKVNVILSYDSDKYKFPTDKNGVLLWHPRVCIQDLISHGLFKEHDASYMCELWDGLFKFENWNIKLPIELEKRLMEIFIKNHWEHPEFEGGKDLRKKFKTLDEALQSFVYLIEEDKNRI